MRASRCVLVATTLCCLGCLASAAAMEADAAEPTLALQRLSDPNAVCLDGSPGAYYESLNPASTQWIFWMMGGGWCYTPEG